MLRLPEGRVLPWLELPIPSLDARGYPLRAATAAAYATKTAGA